MRFTPLLGLLFLCGGPAMAQSTSCDQAQEVWKSAVKLTAATSADGGQIARLTTGEPTIIALRSDVEVAYVTTPQREGDAPSFGGVVSFETIQTGRYRVWLEEAAWVDVVDDGKPAEPADFGRAPECSAMHKQVTFDLDPGIHTLEISRNPNEDVGMLVEIVTGG